VLFKLYYNWKYNLILKQGMFNENITQAIEVLNDDEKYFVNMVLAANLSDIELGVLRDEVSDGLQNGNFPRHERWLSDTTKDHYLTPLEVFTRNVFTTNLMLRVGMDLETENSKVFEAEYPKLYSAIQTIGRLGFKERMEVLLRVLDAGTKTLQS
jgi:hypothetical protein